MKKILMMFVLSSSAFALNIHHSIICHSANVVDAGYAISLEGYNLFEDTIEIQAMEQSMFNPKIVAQSTMKIQRRKFLGFIPRAGFVIESADKMFKMHIKKDFTGEIKKVNGEKVEKDFKKVNCSQG